MVIRVIYVSFFKEGRRCLIVISEQGGERLVKKEGRSKRRTSRRVEEEGLPARTDVPRPRLTDTNGIFLKRRIQS